MVRITDTGYSTSGSVIARFPNGCLLISDGRVIKPDNSVVDLTPALGTFVGRWCSMCSAFDDTREVYLCYVATGYATRVVKLNQETLEKAFDPVHIAGYHGWFGPMLSLADRYGAKWVHVPFAGSNERGVYTKWWFYDGVNRRYYEYLDEVWSYFGELTTPGAPGIRGVMWLYSWGYELFGWSSYFPPPGKLLKIPDWSADAGHMTIKPMEYGYYAIDVKHLGYPVDHSTYPMFIHDDGYLYFVIRRTSDSKLVVRRTRRTDLATISEVVIGDGFPTRAVFCDFRRCSSRKYLIAVYATSNSRTPDPTNTDLYLYTYDVVANSVSFVTSVAGVYVGSAYGFRGSDGAIKRISLENEFYIRLVRSGRKVLVYAKDLYGAPASLELTVMKAYPQSTFYPIKSSPMYEKVGSVVTDGSGYAEFTYGGPLALLQFAWASDVEGFAESSIWMGKPPLRTVRLGDPTDYVVE